MPFISFEGIDQSGKTTQLEMLAAALKKAKIDVLTVREPGGTPLGEQIRDMLLGPEHSNMDKWTEALLYAAARAQLVQDKIRPALKGGAVVIADRYIDSSLAYQGIARGLGILWIMDLNLRVTGRLSPDLTFVLHLDVDASRSRLAGRGKEEDRIESESLEFHGKVEQAYRRLEKMFPERIIGLEAGEPAEEIHARILDACRERLGLEL